MSKDGTVMTTRIPVLFLSDGEKPLYMKAERETMAPWFCRTYLASRKQKRYEY